MTVRALYFVSRMSSLVLDWLTAKAFAIMHPIVTTSPNQLYVQLHNTAISFSYFQLDSLAVYIVYTAVPSIYDHSPYRASQTLCLVAKQTQTICYEHSVIYQVSTDISLICLHS